MVRSRALRFARWAACAGLLVAFALPNAWAGGPRFVTGTTFYATQSGNPIAFRIPNPLYFTDPGDLSPTVNHAQADAMVARAAAIWNIPNASLTLAQGGSLDEHVTAATMTVGRHRGVGFPADVDSSNYLNKPIAVIYDSDGSVLDLLRGTGASSPTGCRENGVVESVDQFGASGTIDHALLILNGRCVTGTGDPLSQMQYQLERAFGRILGLAWSQLNDNVVTRKPQPTADQIDYWPLMHPLDVICGTYTYLCMRSAFTLRPDDRSSLELLYPVTPANLTPGKVLSNANTFQVRASMQFPSGSGMDLVNITVRRMPIGTSEIEPFEVASAVSGVRYQQVFANAVTGAVSGTNDVGTAYQPAQALTSMPYIEVGSGATLFMTTEAINPLYWQEYAVGPYVRPPVTPSGSVQTFRNDFSHPGQASDYTINVADAATNCSNGGDGLETSPAASDPSGWWNGVLCTVGHTSWWTANIQGGRSWTMEVDALDESGTPTLNKAQTVLGLWKSSDPVGTAPTVNFTQVAMNSFAVGVSQLRMPVTAPDASFRVAIADQFGGGRPDFFYRARLLCADAMSPSVVAAAGGQITLTGRGFQPGMQVSVNGVPGTVLSTTATTITAQVPTLAAVHGTAGVPLNVTVTDAQTRGSSTIISALRYSAVTLNTLAVISAPASLKTGISSTIAFGVKVWAAGGATFVPGASVRLSVLSGTATLDACGGASSCVLSSDSSGLVRSTVTAQAAGPIALNATEMSSSFAVNTTVIDTDPVRSAAIADPPRFVAPGAAASWTVTLNALQDGVAVVGVPVTWTVTRGGVLGAAGVLSNGNGSATATVRLEAAAAGTVTLTGCVWVTACASWQVQVVQPESWSISVLSGALQNAALADPLSNVGFLVTDMAGHAIQGAPVALYQTVDGWEGPCPDQGRCAAAPLLASSLTTGTTDSGGLLAVEPLRVPGLPQVVHVAAVTGTDGFAALVLQVMP